MLRYKTGDRVYITKLDQEGVVVNNEGTKLHPYYVSFDGDKDADFFAETDVEPSKQVRLTNDQIDRIITALHNYGTEVQPAAFGLPIYNDQHIAAMRTIVQGLLTPGKSLPERREQPRIFTELDQKIAEDAALFEEGLGVHPERTNSDTYPWGWRYVSDTIQKQFREYCTGNNKAV